MIQLASSQRSACVPVSLWRGAELLGWFRAAEIDDTGMLVNGPIDKLADNSIVTVSIEFKYRDTVNTLTVKALVVHSPESGKELWWVNQQAGLRPSNDDSIQEFALPSTLLIRSLAELL